MNQAKNWQYWLKPGLAVFAIAALILVSKPAAAQNVMAGVTGTVTDPSGAPVPGARVTATNTAEGVEWHTVTNGVGVYTFVRLPVGQYSVKVEAKGFATALRPPFTLVLNQRAQVNIQLKLGSVEQTIRVTAAPPLLQTQTTQVSTLINASTAAALPLAARNYNQLALLTPGAVTTSPASFNTGRNSFNAGRPMINGNREQANYYLLDGMDNNEFVDNNVAYTPSIDAIQEFNVITNNPGAQYGQFLGGVISVSIKSGTNQFHGDAFEFLRNDALNANEWSNNFTDTPRPLLRWNEFGATFGGPIKRNKLFFFADYQGSRFDTPASPGPITTFTTLQQTNPGNLSDLPGISLHYPGTTTPMPANLTLANQCSSAAQMELNATAASPCIFLSPLAEKLLATFPKATGPGTINNAVNSTHTFTNSDQGDLKIDWAVDEKDHVFGRYTQENITNPTINSQPLLYNGAGNVSLPIWNDVLDWTRTIDPSLVNEARVGINYFPAEANVQSASGTNFGALIPGEPTSFLPGIYFAGGAVGGSQNGPFPFGTVDGPEIFHQTVIQAGDSAIWTRGSHIVHFGVQYLRYRNDYIPATTSDGAAGQIGFSGAFTGNAEADFLAGLPSYEGVGKGFNGTVGQRSNAIGVFGQDDWRVNSRLTLNIGLRWQLFTPIYEVGNRMTNFALGTGAIELAGVDGNSRALYNQYNGIANFQPRFGIAWRPFGQNTVVRAGFTISSFREGTGEYNRLPTNAPWNSDLTYTATPLPDGGVPASALFLDDGFQPLLSSQSGAPCTVDTVTSAPASCFRGIRIHMTVPNYRPAVSRQWNLTLEHQFGDSTTVSAAYVGQYTDHVADIVDAGQRFIESENPLVTVPTLFLSGNPTLLADGPGQIRLNDSSAIENYNALQLNATKRLSNGLQFMASYVWGKCMTNNFGYYGRYGDSQGSQATADVAFQEYAYDLNRDYGLCDHNVTQDFDGYATYDLPYGRNRSFGRSISAPLNALLGDWRVSTVFTFHTGFPISMLYYGFDPTGAYFQPRPDCIAPSLITPYREWPGGGYQWFSTQTMAAPPNNRLGNCSVSTEQGPGMKEVDIGISKFFPIGESKSFEFRAEAINAFNYPIFLVNAYSIDIFGGAQEGVVNSSLGARNIQFALKFHF